MQQQPRRQNSNTNPPSWENNAHYGKNFREVSSFFFASYLSSMLTITELRRRLNGAKRNTIGSCAVTWKFRSVQWTWEVRTGNRVYGWILDLFASVLSRFACALGRFTNVLITLMMVISVNHERKSRKSLTKRLITCERNDLTLKKVNDLRGRRRK